MVDSNVAPEQQPGEVYYTEQVVEYVSNRRQRLFLALMLVFAILALLTLSYFVLKAAPGTAAPDKGTKIGGLEWVRSIYGWGNKQTEALRSPTDVAIASNGTIWVVVGHDTIAGFNADGTAKRVIKPKGTASLEGIAVGDDGNLYVADFGGKIIELNQRGKLLDQWAVQLPQELDVRDGKIAVATANGIAIFTPDGKIISKWGTRGRGSDQFDLPHGIILAPDGTVFVSDTQNARVKAYSPEGRVLWTTGKAPDRKKLADPRDDPSLAKEEFALPAGMTLNGKGQVCIVDPFNFRITVLDPKTGEIVKVGSGKSAVSAKFGDFGQTDGFFAYPTGISYDKNRDWFAIADTANNRVQLVRLPGSGGSTTGRIVGGFKAPMCIFAFPLILLLIAMWLSTSGKRRRRELTDETPIIPGTPAA